MPSICSLILVTTESINHTMKKLLDVRLHRIHWITNFKISGFWRWHVGFHLFFLFARSAKRGAGQKHNGRLPQPRTILGQVISSISWIEKPWLELSSNAGPSALKSYKTSYNASFNVSLSAGVSLFSTSHYCCHCPQLLQKAKFLHHNFHQHACKLTNKRTAVTRRFQRLNRVIQWFIRSNRKTAFSTDKIFDLLFTMSNLFPMIKLITATCALSPSLPALPASWCWSEIDRAGPQLMITQTSGKLTPMQSAVIAIITRFTPQDLNCSITLSLLLCQELEW